MEITSRNKIVYDRLHNLRRDHRHLSHHSEYDQPLGHIKMRELETLVARCEGVPFSTEQLTTLRKAAILFEGDHQARPIR